MKAADLSVIVPNYNHAQYLPRSLDAILGQSVRPKEVLVIDDCSADDSARIIEGIARHNPIVRLVRNDRNQGAVATINRGLKLATSTYLFSSAADDFILPGFIERSMDLLAQNPQAGLSCAYHSTIDGKTGAVTPNPSHWCDQPRYLSPAELAGRIGIGCVPGHTTIYKRSSLERAGWFLSDLRWYSDWFLNLAIAFRDGLCHLPQTLALLTVLPSSYSAPATRAAAAHLEVLGALLSLLTSADYRDVAPFFQSSGVMGALGPDIVRAVAARPDRWQPSVLGFINGLSHEQYEALLLDDNLEVRALAGYSLGRLSRLARDWQARVEAELARVNGVVAAMESSKFWKMRTVWMRCKRALRRPSYPSAAR